MHSSVSLKSLGQLFGHHDDVVSQLLGKSSLLNPLGLETASASCRPKRNFFVMFASD